MEQIRFIDLFSGIGGMRIAFHNAGASCVFSSEIDKFARRTYEANFNDAPVGDITKVSSSEIPDFDMIINATSVGLNIKDEINLDFSKIGEGKFFYDIIYNSKETDFLKKGKMMGNKIENGKKMFIYQAFEAFRLWHKIEPEINEETFKLLDND